MIGIIGAMAEEITLLKEQMRQGEEIHIRKYTFIKGILSGKPVVLVESGIGKVNAAVVASILIQEFKVDYLINTGTAGAIDPGLRVEDTVIAHSLTYHDVDVTGFGYKLGQMAGMPDLYYPDLGLVRLAQEVIRELGQEPIIGQIVSGDQFIHSPQSIKDIRSHFPKARACEMESTAIAQVAYSMEVPFLIVRAISDTADHQATLTFDQFLEIAGAHSAKIVSLLIDRLEL